MTGSFLARMARTAQATVDEAFYTRDDAAGRPGPSLAMALEEPGVGIVAEVKPASPTRGRFPGNHDAGALAMGFLQAGARGVSVLTEPTLFDGSLGNLEAASAAGGPTLLKDFVVDARQLDAAAACGASAVLLILDLLERDDVPLGLQEAVDAAHHRGLEVLLEVYDEPGYEAAQATDADILGVNNRDLRDPDLPMDRERTGRVLEACGTDRPTMALSGVETPGDVRRQLETGADAVLVGTVLMEAADPVTKLRELMA